MKYRNPANLMPCGFWCWIWLAKFKRSRNLLGPRCFERFPVEERLAGGDQVASGGPRRGQRPARGHGLHCLQCPILCTYGSIDYPCTYTLSICIAISCDHFLFSLIDSFFMLIRMDDTPQTGPSFCCACRQCYWSLHPHLYCSTLNRWTPWQTKVATCMWTAWLGVSPPSPLKPVVLVIAPIPPF